MVHIKKFIQEIARRASRQIRVIGSRSRRQPQAKPGNSQWQKHLLRETLVHVVALTLAHVTFETIRDSFSIIHQTQ